MTSLPASENQRVAARLREAGERLEQQGANAFAAAAFQRAADSVEGWPCPLREIYERRGEAGLQQLPGVGRGIARAIAEMLVTGRWLRLERMRPERSFLYTGDDGLEHECVVVEARPTGERWGREAILELLRRDRHNGRS
jgi:helix-hairpin-helix protein